MDKLWYFNQIFLNMLLDICHAPATPTLALVLNRNHDTAFPISEPTSVDALNG